MGTKQLNELDKQKVRENDRGVVVVTGGAGFLGSYLIDRLVEDGHNVLCVDNLLTGRLSNIARHMGNQRFQFLKHDIIDPFDVPDAVSEIYNLACPASPPIYERDPVHTFKTCIFGASNVLELALRKGAKVLQASTSEVYGDPAVSPQPEYYFGNVNTVGPRSCYDEGKRGAETLFHNYNEQYGVETKVARIFNTYGPRMRLDDGRVVSNFVAQALTDQDLTVYGDGSQTRSFCYVTDLVEALLRLMSTPPDHVDPFNLGNPAEFTIMELAHLVLQKTGSKSQIRYLDYPQDDPHRRKPDITRAKEVLDWEPLLSLSDGLDQMIPEIADQLMTAGEASQ